MGAEVVVAIVVSVVATVVSVVVIVVSVVVSSEVVASGEAPPPPAPGTAVDDGGAGVGPGDWVVTGASVESRQWAALLFVLQSGAAKVGVKRKQHTMQRSNKRLIIFGVFFFLQTLQSCGKSVMILVGMKNSILNASDFKFFKLFGPSTSTLVACDEYNCALIQSLCFVLYYFI